MKKLDGFDYRKAEADLDDIGDRHPDEIYSYHSEKGVRGYMKEHGLNPDKYYKPDRKNTRPGSNENDNGGCYLTTACVAARGLSDTGPELQTLRAFRDGVLAHMPGGQEEIEEYYEINTCWKHWPGCRIRESSLTAVIPHLETRILPRRFSRIL